MMDVVSVQHIPDNIAKAIEKIINDGIDAGKDGAQVAEDIRLLMRKKGYEPVQGDTIGDDKESSK